MNSDLPYALIIGIEHFAAKKLAEELVSKDINVVGVGEYINGLNEIRNFEYFANLEEVSGNFNYVFDFNCDINKWNALVEECEKLTLISVNNKEKTEAIKEELRKINLNWRLVEANGVYGPGMEDDEDDKNVGFLVRAFKQAVLNQNLTLPPVENRFRVLCVDDLVEAVLRASFLSGTEGDVYNVAGEEMNSEILAGVLINEAKMTRYKVMQKNVEMPEWDEKEIGKTQKKLRWQAKVGFNNGVKETLQYFFVKIDEESRKKPEKKQVIIKPVVEEREILIEKKESRKKQMEVVVEEETEDKKEAEVKIEPKIEEVKEIEEKKPEKILRPLVFDEPKTEEEEKKEEVVEEEMDSFEPFVIKNSNLRQARGLKEEKSKLVEEEKPKVIEEKKVVKNNKSKLWIKEKGLKFLGIGSIVVLAIMVGLVVSWGAISWSAFNSLKNSQNLIKSRKYDEAEKIINKQFNRLKNIDEKIDDWGLNGIALIRNYQSAVRVGEESLKLENRLITVAESGDKINDAIFKDKKINWDQEITTVNGNLEELSSEMGILQARLSGDWDWLPMRWRSSLQKKSTELGRAKNYIELASRAMKIMPEFLGLDGKKREYMVLLQNESELRPGGGFIGSYGLLSFQNGKLLNFTIKDVYEADGQLNGHVEPPEEIKNILGEANFYMRDANWNPNFPNAAIDLQWFLDKETNKKVDGVIGINLGAAKAVLGAVGEVYVPDFKERINKDNLYEQAEFYAETKFFPGSIQKASFLGALGKQLFESIQNLKADQKLGLMQAMIDSLEKNNIQMALNNKEAAEVMNGLSWDGSIYRGKCGMEGCVGDYLYVVEANLGVNKANYFLYRNMEESIDISNSSISRVLKINYENTAKNTNWPGGDYKNYMRIYLPLEVNLSEVSLMDTNNSSSKKVYSMSELKIKEVNGKKEVGFLVTVPVMSKRTLEVRYSSSVDLSKKSKFSYVNYIQKQSGFGDTGLVVLVSFPPGWQPIQVQPAASLVGGRLLFNSRLDQNMKMGVELSK